MRGASRSRQMISSLPALSVRAIKFVLTLIIGVMGVGAYYASPGSSAAPAPSQEKVSLAGEVTTNLDALRQAVEGDDFSSRHHSSRACSLT